MLRPILLGLAGALAVAFGAHADPSAPKVTVVAEGLAFPWGAAFLPGGDILVTERDGRLRVIRDGKLAPEPVAGLPPIYVAGQGGLLDVAVHPRFAETKRVYISYAHGTKEANGLRVARGTFDGTSLSNLEVVFDSTPGHTGENNFGGRMLFLADGSLLVSVGEGGATTKDKAQALDSDLGKVVRIADDGTVPADNPFVGQSGARPEIWALGVRNGQGLALDPATGTVYGSDHGPPGGGDELNVIVRGANYGWPKVNYLMDDNGVIPILGKEPAGMTAPLKYWNPTLAPSGIAVYSGNRFPAWKGDVFLAGLAGMQLLRVDVENGKVVGEEPLLVGLEERIRSVTQGPDGLLYVTTDSDTGRVLRIEPAG
jgi:glucose/arabinose dehydrogenase